VVFDYRHPRSPSLLGDDLDCIHLLDDPMRVVLPADHPLARRKSIRLEELADEAWVGGCGGGVCNAMVMHWCSDAGFEPNIAFESDDHNVLIGLVAAGMGVALLPELALRIRHPDVAIRPVAGSQPMRRIFAATPKNGYRSPATEAMIEILASAVDDPAVVVA
jgi:DNA-binding transcriptional LysR family regulator